jgi:hypothetical protein
LSSHAVTTISAIASAPKKAAARPRPLSMTIHPTNAIAQSTAPDA